MARSAARALDCFTPPASAKRSFCALVFGRLHARLADHTASVKEARGRVDVGQEATYCFVQLVFGASVAVGLLGREPVAGVRARDPGERVGPRLVVARSDAFERYKERAGRRIPIVRLTRR